MNLTWTLPRTRRSAPTRQSTLPVPRSLIFLLLGFLTLSLSGRVFIDSEINGQFHFIFTYLTFPLFALSYSFGWLRLAAWRQQASLAGRLLWPGALALLLLFTCNGLVDYANALLPNGPTLEFRGPICDLKLHSGRRTTSYSAVMRDTATGQKCEFRLSRPEYQRLKVGEEFQRTMRQGGLGYAYRWR